jgi:hypothetical protein
MQWNLAPWMVYVFLDTSPQKISEMIKIDF